MRRLAFGLGLLCWAALGCSLKVPRVGEPAPVVADVAAERAYQKTLDHFTANREVYVGFDTRFLAAATYQSPSFRVARVKREAVFLQHPPELVSKALADEERDGAQFIDFVFGVHVNERRFEDFDKKDSVWRVVLVSEAGQTTPLSIERLGRSHLHLRAYYPYLDDFWVAYRFRFPRVTASGQPSVPAGAKTLTLRIASPLAAADFTVPAE
jgi:hypothetical protein